MIRSISKWTLRERGFVGLHIQSKTASTVNHAHLTCFSMSLFIPSLLCCHLPQAARSIYLRHGRVMLGNQWIAISVYSLVQIYFSLLTVNKQINQQFYRTDILKPAPPVIYIQEVPSVLPSRARLLNSRSKDFYQ